VVLQAFRTRFPAVELVLCEMTTAQQVRALHDGRVHVGLVRPPIEDET
jgi:DNA-binding transcriptional LysR family regulator